MYSHILVPVVMDDNPNASAALTAARTLGNPDAVVTLLHVMEEVPHYAISYMPQGYVEQLRDAIKAEIDVVAATFKKGRTVLATGKAGRVILDYAGENGVDCIVIASHHPGISDYFLGSTAAHVVRHAQCSVHVVR